jgi:phage virion morphogenesis protein
MMRVEITEETVTTGLARLAAALGDMSEPMSDIGELMLASTQDRIAKGLDVDGKPFTPRSATTVERYGKLGLKYGAPLNQSGRMRKGIAYNSGPDWMEVGSNAIQAAVMHFGASKGSLGSGAPWGNIPARAFLGVSDEDSSKIHEAIEEWLAKVVVG